MLDGAFIFAQCQTQQIIWGVLNFSQQWLLPLQDSGPEPRQYPAIYKGQSIENIITAKKKTGSRQIEPLPEKNWHLPQVGSNGETTTVTLDPGGPQVIGTLAFDLGFKDTLYFSSLIPSAQNSVYLRKKSTKCPTKFLQETVIDANPGGT